uniref:PfkB domain-containing protein n=1 Tax=Parastrongyloides trichosuri TaxID=131310 RepID=A0A0N4ZDU2_PARTI
MLISKIKYIFKRSINNKLNLPNYIKFSDEVKDGLMSNKPIVALESTVITHGLPYPDNIKLGNDLEEIIRRNECVPATISLMNGKVNIGTSRKDLEMLGDPKVNPVKVSTRDISNTIVSKRFGGTTVAGTMFLSNLVGIKFFATGGIGGVHRGVEQTFDISCDLIELSRTNVVVVCSGAKSILDVGKTLEFLETHGVNVIVKSDTNDFPGFFVKSSGFQNCYNENDIDKIVDIIKVSKEIGNRNGILVSVPIPESDASNGIVIEDAIQQSLAIVKSQNISGRDVTPFILKQVRQLTKGASLTSNVALLKNNAQTASILASKYFNTDKEFIVQSKFRRTMYDKSKKKVAVIGASIIDIDAITEYKIENTGTSYPGEVHLKPGGVGRNHADALTKLQIQTTLLSAIGKDQFGLAMENFCQHMNIQSVLRIPNERTPVYSGLTTQGNVFCGIMYLGNIMSYISPEYIKEKENILCDSDYIIIDGNLNIDTIKKVNEISKYYNKKLWYEPTDILKVKKIFEQNGEMMEGIRYFSPNRREFNEFCLLKKIPMNAVDGSKNEIINFIEKNHQRLFNNDMEICLVTLDKDGVIAWDNNEKKLYQREAPKYDKIISASGAGDCFNSGFLASMIGNKTIDESLSIASNCARQSLESTKAVPDDLRIIN